MKKQLIWGASVIGAGALLSLVHIYLTAPASERTVSVSGECLTTAPKDRTALTLRVRVVDRSAAVSMKKATARVTEVTEFLKTVDVKMQTTQFDSYEKTEWNHVSQKSISMGYETSIAIDVSAEKIETIETVLNKFAGQENIYSENFRMFTSAETMKPVLEKCLGDAVANARARAGALAAGDGRKVGKLLDVTYSNGGSIDARPMNFARGMKMEEAITMDFGGGLVSQDTNVSVTVSATFEVR